MFGSAETNTRLAIIERDNTNGIEQSSGPMIYLKWTPSDLATLRVGALYTEIDEDGWVQRELGIGDDGLITHQLVPSDARPGWFGLARLSLIMLTSNVTKAEFESLWHAGSGRSAER